ARPLHVFDAKKVNGNLTVRRAKDGESLLALDGRTYTLDPSICVIADEHGVESLAGIMGGETSGCDENTTDVLIESALWNEINIAQTGRKLGINSDARYRFERGVDPAFMVPGLELATQLVIEMCGGTVPETPFGRGEKPRKSVLTTMQLRTGRARRALAARGMVEAVTWSFISKPHAELFDRDPPVTAQANRRGHPELSLANPIAAD